MDLQWDRKFGDGTVAPTGDYEVLLQAWDQLGNGRYITSRIYIPEAGATAVIPLGDVVSGGTFEDTPTPMAQQTQTEESGVVPAVPAATEEAPTPAPEPSSTPSSLSFSSPPVIPASGESKSTSLPVDPNLLTGAAALAAAASATAYSLQRKEEKEAERKRQEEQSKAEAMAIVRAAEATKVSNYLQKLMNDEKEKWLNDLRETEGQTYFDLTDEEKEILRKTNIGAYIAVGEYFNEVGQQSAELGRLIASTGGRAITDLSEEQLDEFLDQGLGAKIVVGNYLAPQIKEAKETAEQNAEWSRIIASTGGRAITDLSKEQQDEFLEQGNGAILAANNYYSPLIAEAKRTAEQNAEWSRIIASTGGRVITDLTPEQRDEFLDQGNGAMMAAGNYFAPLQAAYDRYMAEKAYTDKMNQVEQETKDRNVLREVPETIPYYPMNGGYTQEELQAMVAANLDRYAELEGKPTIDEKIQKNPIYQWFAPRLAIYHSINETLTDMWHETDVYKYIKPKIDWVVDRYMSIWDTVETAWKISTNKNSTYWQKLGATIYMEVAVIAHVMLAIGLGILAISAVPEEFFVYLDMTDNAKTLITAPIQYAAGELTIGELGFQVIVSALDFEIPGGKKVGELAGNSALEIGLRNIDEAMEVVNPAKIGGNLDELGDTLDLFSNYGKPAALLLDSVDVTDARKLLDNLDVWDVDNLLKLDSSVIKRIAKLDDVAIKGLSGKLDVIIDLGDDAIKQVNQHGIDLIPFFNFYEDDGLKLLKNNDEAAEFVLKYWNDAPDKVDLAVDFGKPAMQLMDSVDAAGARKLLDNLNTTDIENIIKLDGKIINNLADMDPVKLNGLIGKFDVIADLGDDAIAQINRYGPEIIPVLFEHGDEGVEFFKLFEGDLTKVIVNYRCGKFAGELSEEGESILSYLSSNADNLLLSEAEGKLLSFSDEIVHMNDYLTEGEGSLFEIIKEQTAEAVNKELFENGYTRPGILPNTEAYVIKLNKDQTFVRVYDEITSDQPGQWFMRYEDIDGLSPLEIQQKFSLPSMPTMITDVKLKAGDMIRISIANDVKEFNGIGGGIQFDLLNERIGEFVNGRKLIP